MVDEGPSHWDDGFNQRVNERDGVSGGNQFRGESKEDYYARRLRKYDLENEAYYQRKKRIDEEWEAEIKAEAERKRNLQQINATTCNVTAKQLSKNGGKKHSARSQSTHEMTLEKEREEIWNKNWESYKERKAKEEERRNNILWLKGVAVVVGLYVIMKIIAELN